jgi:hypothetical protein
MGPYIFNAFLSMTKKMQCCVILFITVNAVHVSSSFSTHHQEFKSVHAASGICQTCLLLPLAVIANKFDKYLLLHVQIFAPDDERKNRSKKVER